ncbi:MAG TPA: ATP-binding cassette domain-containing protein [Solirubrobacteraceae bacterium]|nr:ATP-binding cassette domain-containing protein [Solirubrobacteraceae bacterium]
MSASARPGAGPDLPAVESGAVLVLERVSAGYGGHEVVHEASLSLAPGSIECIVGPNGAGKSTLLRAVTADAELLAGRVLLAGREVTRMPANRLVARGLAWVPQLDDVFTTLTVIENLELGGFLLDRRRLSARVDEVLELFPLLAPLRSRVAGRLSGGERKLLAIARALMPAPSTLLLDEPTAGLSPEMTGLVLEDQLPRLSASGVAILLVEQRAIEAIEISSRVHVMVSGEIRVSRRASEVRDWDALARLFLGEE